MSLPSDKEAKSAFVKAKRAGKWKALLNLLLGGLVMRSTGGQTIDEFHKLYYNASALEKTWKDTTWFGIKTWKLPLDMWIYQEILFETQPDLIIETGTAFGGSAFYLSFLCDHLEKGRIVSIDIEMLPGRPEHPRITYLQGSSTTESMLEKVKSLIKRGERVMVILDSDHRRDHVLEELKRYSPLVSPGCYLIVEDTNMNGHPVYPEWGPGPMEALEEFLKTNPPFDVDQSREKFLFTFNPRGYLRRKN